MKTILYAIELTAPRAKVSRFALYRITRKHDHILKIWHPALEVIWHHEEDKTRLLPCQVYFPKPSRGPDYPAYHFKIGDIGYSKIEYLTKSLIPYFGKDLEILILGGCSPSVHL